MNNNTDQNKNEGQELRKHLFSQLERLSTTPDLDNEIKRAKAIASVGTVIVNSHKQEVDMLKLDARQSPKKAKEVPMLPMAGGKAAGKKKRIGNG